MSGRLLQTLLNQEFGYSLVVDGQVGAETLASVDALSFADRGWLEFLLSMQGVDMAKALIRDRGFKVPGYTHLKVTDCNNLVAKACKLVGISQNLAPIFQDFLRMEAVASLMPLLPLLNKTAASFDLADAHAVLKAMGFEPEDVDPELVSESVTAINTSNLDSVSTVLSREEFLVPFVNRLMKSRDRQADQLELDHPYVPVKCYNCGKLTDVHRADVRAEFGGEEELTVRCAHCGAQRFIKTNMVRYFGV